MLRELTIRNVAVIEVLGVTFQPGLNLLTGETGAGKSILIDALQLVLGARSSVELIRAGSEEASVEAAFDLPDGPEVAGLLEAEGIPVEAGEGLLLRRQLFADGRSRAYLNGRLTTAATLRALAERLVDIHGQHPGQPLLEPRRHGEFLDEYAGLAGEVREYRQRFHEWQGLRREREALAQAARERAQREDLLDFQCREIEAARLAPGEDEALEAEHAILSNHERLFSAVAEVYAAVEESDEAVVSRLGAAAHRLGEAAAIDPRLGEVLEGLQTASIQLREAARALRDYRGRLEFDPGRLEAVEARLHELGKLKRKYGASVGEILAHLARVQKERDGLQRAEERRDEVERELGMLSRDLLARATRLSAARAAAASRLQAAILGELKELGMARARFQVRLDSAPAGGENLGPHGLDAVEFLIAPNPGEAPKPLHRVASGGELSRVMLAVRSILAAADRTPTVVFDEVDAGVGGAMADVVGRKLAGAARRHQVLCVTHLPQIACFADHHLTVAKRVQRDRTQTAVQPLAPADRAVELARMLGGRADTALQHAQELL
ncbi:MAG: DNA repair protein RecN, partial [Candidatus Methylomirabilales bacterium]